MCEILCDQFIFSFCVRAGQSLDSYSPKSSQFFTLGETSKYKPAGCSQNAAAFHCYV